MLESLTDKITFGMTHKQDEGRALFSEFQLAGFPSQALQ